MEGSDPFNAGVDAPQDDPFAGADKDFEQDDPFASEQAHAESIRQEGEPPIVNKEGEVIGEAEPDPSQAGTPAAPSSDTSSETANTDGDGADGEGDPTAGAGEAAAAEAASSEEPGAEAGSEPEPEAEVPATKKNQRVYRILTPTGEGKWEEVSWWVNAEGHMVPKGTEGAVKQKRFATSSPTAALRVGYRAMGAPVNGVGLVAIPEKMLEVKRVAPKSEPVQRVRVTIS